MDCASVNRDFHSTGKERIKIHKTETAINFKRYGQRTTIHELFLSAKALPEKFVHDKCCSLGCTRLSPCQSTAT